jgi:hypothetical protein
MCDILARALMLGGHRNYKLPRRTEDSKASCVTIARTLDDETSSLPSTAMFNVLHSLFVSM